MNQYLVVDRGVFEGHTMENALLRVNKLEKDMVNNPLFTQEYQADPPKKWEVRFDNGYPNVFYDSDYGILRCYYTLISKDEEAERHLSEGDQGGVGHYQPLEGRITSLAYAYSEDGVHWIKPELGLVEFDGSTDNNLLMMYAHGTGVMRDERETNPARRYKMATKIEYPNGQNYMASAFSADGIHFDEVIPWPEHNPQGDAHNFPFYDRMTESYRLITRTWQNSIRVVSMSESHDFVNWSKPREVLRGRGFGHQIYSMPVFEYAGIYLGLASVYHEGDVLDADYDLVDVELMFSTDLTVFDSVSEQDYLIERGRGEYPAGEFDCGCIYMSTPVEIGGRLYFYYMGGNGRHTDYRETSLARAWLPKDRFACYCEKRPGRPALLSTYHFSILGNELFINADIEEGGFIEVELGTRKGKTFPGFERENCTLLSAGIGIWQVVFPGHALEELLCEQVCMRFTILRARLYAIQGDIEIIKLKY